MGGVKIRTLVIYYSFEGMTEMVAKTIAKELGGDLSGVIPKNKIETEKLMSYYWGGDRKVPERSVPVEDLDKDPAGYDLIFIGTPVWAWSPAPPVHSLLSGLDIAGKNIALFATSEGDPGKVFSKMKEQLGDNRIIAQMEFVVRDPLDEFDIRKNAAAWARKVSNKIK